MKAIDTNVLLRLITRDDEVQLDIAEKLLADAALWVSLTVIVETEWVLRSFYGWSKLRIADAFDGLAAIDEIALDRQDAVLWAIDRLRNGADFADLIHLVAAEEIGSFVTFDRRLANQAGSSTPVAIEILA